jgi:hypothetical protein
MPEGFTLPNDCRDVKQAVPLPIHSVVSSAIDDASVALAVLLAADSLDLVSPGTPLDDCDCDGAPIAPPPTLFCARGTETPCDLRVRLCRDAAVDSAVAHLSLLLTESGTRCGPLPSSVAGACGQAHRGIAGALAGPAFVSHAGADIGMPTVLGVIAPYSRRVLWSFESTRWPPQTPTVSFVPTSRERRSLGRLQTGRLYSCSVIGDGADAAGRPCTAERIAATIMDFMKVVSGLLRQVQQA